MTTEFRNESEQAFPKNVMETVYPADFHIMLVHLHVTTEFSNESEQAFSKHVMKPSKGRR